MLTEEQLINDLTSLRGIALKHKAAGSEFETKKTVINGHELDVFCSIPNNLYEVYRLSLEEPNATFLVYEEERYSFGETFDAASRMVHSIHGSNNSWCHCCSNEFLVARS
jgi:hypothetical protein